jgi:hypothetical protein
MSDSHEHDGKLCASCRKAMLGWVDEIGALDRHLAMLGELCEAAEEAHLGGATIAELGVAIRNYRERRAIIDYYFMGGELVTLATVNLDEDHSLVRGELARLLERPAARRRRLC